MNEITYRIDGNYAIVESPANFYSCRAEIFNPLPVIGQKYLVVFYCDYDNTEYGDNYTVEITEENIAEITFHMNDTQNDITEYILVK